jgi:hypothetical protein
MIPLVSGNLSVEYLMKSLAGGPVPAPGSNRAEIEQLAALKFGALEDYIGWGVVEPREGEFDWSYHRANLERCRQLGLRYVVYPWIHVVPAWWIAKGSFVGFRCLEHDEECGWPSIFDPAVPDLYRRFYAELARALGDGIDSVCVALTADYGEVGYPTGWGSWVCKLTAPRDHVHPGFWCGDAHAREALRRFALARHGSLDGVNRAWETSFESPAEITHPRPDSSLTWRRDFGDFYVGAMVDFADRVVAIARQAFPDKPLWIKVGHGGEPLMYGIDPTRIAKVAARHGAGVRTTQATLPALHQKRLATPCRHYAVPLASEPPVDVGREMIVERLFNDATSGTVEYFEYQEHMVGARDLIARYGGLLTGEASRCDVGLYFPASDQRLHPEQGLPPVLVDLAETIRDRIDYELVDETTIRDGALAGLEVFGLLEGEHLDVAAQEEIVRFVARGGRLVVGPEFRTVGRVGPLHDLLARAPDAGACVDLIGAPTDSMVALLGSAGDYLRLAGEWFHRENAGQFRGRIPEGEFARWSSHRASTFFPVRAGKNYLLEIECWLHPQTVHLKHEVKVNGSVVGSITRPGLQRFAAWVPSDLLVGGGVAEVALENETFRSVDLDGAGADTRELGVAVMWQRLTEEGSPSAGLRGGDPPKLTGRVRRADLAARGQLAHGEGAVVYSRQRPLVAFLALLEDQVERHSAVVRDALNGAVGRGALEGLRATVFDGKILLWNRTLVDRELELTAAGRAPERVVVPAGGLVAMDRKSGRVLP